MSTGCSKHVQKWNKHIKKCVKFVINTNYNNFILPSMFPMLETVFEQVLM